MANVGGSSSSSRVSSTVLSVQSHVVHGYVGNRAAVFPLQLLGLEVDVINSVQFSCHTGYPVIRGRKLEGKDLKELVDGLAANEVLNHSHLLTGYIGTASFLREVVELRKQLPKGSRYICDPVLGDNGQLYTSKELVDVYREEVLSHVTILTPNQFEAELLTQSTITNLAEAAKACNALHERGPEMVVITTLDVPDATREGTMVAMMLSQAGRQKWLLRLPFVAGGPFTGTGDLTSAMLLAWSQLHPLEAPAALEKTGAVLQAVLSHTREVEPACTVGGKWVPPELRILDCKRSIEAPTITVHCSLLEPPALRVVLLHLESALMVPRLEPLQDLLQDGRLQHFRRPGMADCLERLLHSGLHVGIVSSSTTACVEACLQEAGCTLRASLPVLTPSTPMPEGPPLRCCRDWETALGAFPCLEPSALLVVSGEQTGLQAARTAGCFTVAMLGTHVANGDCGEADEALAAIADHTISTLEAMKRFIG